MVQCIIAACVLHSPHELNSDDSVDSIKFYGRFVDDFLKIAFF